MNANTAINAYAKVGTESGVIGADPHMLISLLFKGALLAIANAKSEILHKETAAKGQSISRAIAIVGQGLNASLDKSVGGELAQNLSALYDYMTMRLVEANLKNDVAILEEVAGLLTELRGAWDGIRPAIMQTTTQPNGSATKQRIRATA